MITITPAATLAVKDSGISANPNPVAFGGIAVNCPVGQLEHVAVLAAATVAASLPFPVGVTTAAVLAIRADLATDLLVNYDGAVLTVPLGQPLFLYDVLASDLTVSSALGGKITYVVGG